MSTELSEWLLSPGFVAAIAFVVKLTLVAAGGLVAARLASRASASLRHHILACTFVVLLLLPIAGMIVPPLTMDLPIGGAPSAASLEQAMAFARGASPQSFAVESSPRTAESWRFPDAASLVLAVWAAGALALAFVLVRAAWRFDRLRRRGLPWRDERAHAILRAVAAGAGRPVDLLLHEEIAAPATWGWKHPAVLLPADATAWADSDLRRALVHELEHVRRGDIVVQLIARTTCALYWFHPLVWIVLRRLRIEAERACDDAVLRHAEGVDYAGQLVQLARRMSASARTQPTLAMANRTDLSTRVAAILDRSQARERLGVMPAALALCGAAVLAVTVAPMRARAVDARDPVVVSVSDRDASRSERRVSARDRTLYESAKDGDLEGITGMLDVGANVNVAIDGDGSPLIAAARAGNLAAVNLLLDHGADVNMVVPGDGSPLIMAAAAGEIAIVQLLLDRGAAIDQVAPGDENALITASGAGILNVVELLVARGADVNARVWSETLSFGGGKVRRGGEWRTALGMARRGGHRAVADYLESVGARE
jgi:beta-lactamase regulating signal transducer with metallopeptidase domain